MVFFGRLGLPSSASSSPPPPLLSQAAANLTTDEAATIKDMAILKTFLFMYIKFFFE